MNWNSIKTVWMFDDPRSYGARQLLLGAADGLRRNGKTVHLHRYHPQDPSADHQLKQSLLTCEPDLIFLANHPSNLFYSNLGCPPLGCPVVVWVFDDPFIMGAEPFAESDIVWIADPSFQKGAAARGAKSIYFVPVAAPCTTPAVYTPEYHAPFAYVGATLRIQHAREQLGEQLAAYLDKIIEIKLQQPQRDFETLLQTHLLKDTGKVQWSGPLGYYLYTEVNRKNRLRYLLPLAGDGLHLYGNEAWKDEIAGTPLQSCYKGPIDPLLDYPKLIASVAVNINLRSMQGISAPVQRDFLIPFTGGFMLSTPRCRTHSDWPLYDPKNRFGLNRFVWSPEYASPEVAVESTQTYIHSEDLRREWIEHARYEIQLHHTFAHRIQQAGEIINESEPDHHE